MISAPPRNVNNPSPSYRVVIDRHRAGSGTPPAAQVFGPFSSLGTARSVAVSEAWPGDGPARVEVSTGWRDVDAPEPGPRYVVEGTTIRDTETNLVADFGQPSPRDNDAGYAWSLVSIAARLNSGEDRPSEWTWEAAR